MPYACWCMDLGDKSALRQSELTDHLEYIEKYADKILAAGPLKNEQDAIVGSLLIFDTEAEAEARELLEQDPYYRAKVWQSATILKLQEAAGTWCGGVSWDKSDHQ